MERLPATEPIPNMTPLTIRRSPLRIAQNTQPNSPETRRRPPLPQPALGPFHVSSDHIDNNTLKQTNNLDTGCPYGCCAPFKMSDHLFKDGFVTDAHYDVIINAFGKKYKLHKLFLDGSAYFKSMFSWSNYVQGGGEPAINSESDVSDSGSEDDYAARFTSSYRKVYELPFDVEDMDKETILCKRKSFELAILRLYGLKNIDEEVKIPYHMIEIGQYLAISEIVCTATEYIVSNMDMSNIADNLRFAITSDYGSASQRIIENGKGILCSNGWERGPASWDKVPTIVISEIIGEDYFFVPTEWDRCIFIIKLIERRLEANSSNLSTDDNALFDDIKPLRSILKEKIHYCHMSPGQLQELEEYVDKNGDNYIEPHVLHSALWQALQLETLVTRADDLPNLDNLISSATQPSKNSNWFKVPSKDETLSGLPKELDALLNQSLSKTPSNKLNPEADSKSTQGDDSGSNDTDIVSNFRSKDERKVYNWTKIPPFRFSISFSNVSELATDKRVYGKTFWYAGSYWNLYLQKSHISSKNSYQVGVYLHRAHNASSNSTSKSGLINPDVFADNTNYKSLPKKYKDSRISAEYLTRPGNNGESSSQELSLDENALRGLNWNMDNLSLHDQNATAPAVHPHIDFRSTSSISSLSTPMPYTTIPSSPTKKRRSGNAGSQSKQSLIDYEDQRNAIKVYFIIFTPSRRSKPTITSFLSVPNDFSKSQSWGWKSNNMCVFNEDGTFAEGQDPNLKFMILLGNV